MGQKKHDNYDNINDMANADYKTIMHNAKTKYNMLLSNKDRPFGSPYEEEQHVIALQAELNEVKDSNLSCQNSSNPSSSLLHQEPMPTRLPPVLRKPKTTRIIQIGDAKSKMRHGRR